MSQQVKSKQRVADHGEVFTAEREVNAMLDLVKAQTERIESRFLEPACGDGNFLAEILRRKLKEVKRKYKRSTHDYEKYAVLAVSSIYGVELLMDNVLACRERLFEIWNTEYTANCKRDAKDIVREAVRFILSRNIVCGNALTLMCVDENGNDTDIPIVFSEWSFITGVMMQRKDYTFEELLNGDAPEKKQIYEGDQQTFDLDDQISLYDNERSEPDPEGKFLGQVVSEYWRVQYHG